MTEVLVSENNVKKSEWYHFRPSIKSEELVPKSIERDDKQNQSKPSKTLWMKIKAIKAKLFKKFDGSDKVRPVFSINERKARVYVEIARGGGGNNFPMS